MNTDNRIVSPAVAGGQRGSVPSQPADDGIQDKVVIIGTGDVTESGPMGEALRYLSTQDMAPGSVVIMGGNPRPGDAPETIGHFMNRVQHGRAPLSAEQLTGYMRMTGFDKLSPDTPLPHCDVTSSADFNAALQHAVCGGNEAFKARIMPYLGLPPFCFGPVLENLGKLPSNITVSRALPEKPFGTSLANSTDLLKLARGESFPVDLIDHFGAYPGTIAMKEMLAQPAFAQALTGQYVDHGAVRMDEQIESSDRPYMRGLGHDPKTGANHGGVAEDMLQSHGWVGLLTRVAGDVLDHVKIDDGSIRRSQTNTFNDPALGFGPSDAATHVSTGFTIDTPQWQGTNWSIESSKGVTIPTDSGASAPPAAWFGAKLHFKALPADLVSVLNQKGGPTVDTKTSGTLSMRVSTDPRFVFTPDGSDKEIVLLTAANIPNPVPPEARLLMDAQAGREENFARPDQAYQGWVLTKQITDRFEGANAVPLTLYPRGAAADSLS